MRLTTLFLCAITAAPAHSQSTSIPAPVIAQCNETASAAAFPTCLKEGAIAFELLDLARSDIFYGPAATPVIEICGERNETFAGQWICFENAATKAAETRELIGLENIVDTCVAEISDAQLAERLAEAYKLRRNEMFPDQMFFGGTSYFPFQGCPAPAKEESNAPRSTGDKVSIALAEALAQREEENLYSTEACIAYAEMEEIISTTETEKLRAMGAELSAIDDSDAANIVTVTGISKDAADFIHASAGRQQMAFAMLLAAFLETYHPELIEEFMSNGQQIMVDQGGEMGTKMARGFLLALTDAARLTYHDYCNAG